MEKPTFCLAGGDRSPASGKRSEALGRHPGTAQLEGGARTRHTGTHEKGTRKGKSSQ